jgi:branched-chain amino acid transport system permease protein
MAAWLIVHRNLVDGIGIDSMMGLSVWIVLACGRVSLGNTGFAAIGAIVTLELAARHNCPLVVAAAGGVASAAAAAYLLGLALARIGNAQFAIATLVFGVAITDGVVIPYGAKDRVAAIAFTPHIYAALVLTALVLWLYMRSREGRAASAVAQDERAASGVGIDPARTRHVAFVAGGSIAGLCGCLMVLHRGLIIVQSFGFDQNVAALAAVVVGGSASVAGPLVGSVVIAISTLVVPSLSSYRAIFQSALLLVCSLALPGGLASIASDVMRRFSRAGHV